MEGCEKLAVSEFNADLIADKRARVYRIINDTRSAEVSGREWPSLMNDFRVNPERSCKRSSSFHAGVGRTVPSLSPFSLSRRSRELPFRTFYFLNNAGTEREKGREGKTSGRWDILAQTTVDARCAWDATWLLPAAGPSINLDHGVISSASRWHTYHATNPFDS